VHFAGDSGIESRRPFYNSMPVKASSITQQASFIFRVNEESLHTARSRLTAV